jgi:N-ethylmaleimide reductase
MPTDPHVEETLLHLCHALSRRKVAYLHMLYQLLPSGNMQESDFKEEHLSDELVRRVSTVVPSDRPRANMTRALNVCRFPFLSRCWSCICCMVSSCGV